MKGALSTTSSMRPPRSYLNHRPNDVMIWNGIRLAKERGLARFDFGLSDWDQEEHIRYKRKYPGRRPSPSWRGARKQSLPEMRSLFGQLTDLPHRRVRCRGRRY